MRRNFLILFIFICLFTSPLWAANDNVNEQAASELSTQTEAYLKQLEPSPSIDAKEDSPVVILEKEKYGPPPQGEASFFVEEIVLEGNTIFEREHLEKYIRDFEYRDITFTELKDLAQLITNHYRAKGFITSYAYLPPQEISNHSVLIKIVEGKIGTIAVEGNKIRSEEDYKKGIVPRVDGVLNYMDLEKNLKELNAANPSEKVKAFLVPSGTPGIINIQLKAEETAVPVTLPETPTPTTAPIPTPVATPAEEIPTIIVEKDAVDLTAKEPLFYVRKIHLDGNTLFTEKDLAKYVSSYENRTTSFLELRELVQLITNHYRLNNFLTSRAYLPPQTIENKEVTIRIIEGKIGEIFVEGNKYYKSSIYQKALTPRKDRIFRYADLEQGLYFLNQKPGRRAKAYLIAGSEPASSDIILKAEEERPTHIYYTFNNRGSKLTHRARNGVSFEHANITGNDDTLLASFSLAEEGALEATSMAYNTVIGDQGMSFDLNFSYVETMLIGFLKPSEVKGNSIYIAPKITYPFISTPRVSLDGTLGFEYKDSKTSADDVQFNADRMRVITIGPDLSIQDGSGRTILTGDAHFGIPKILAGMEPIDPNASRDGTGGKFIYFTGTVARMQRLPGLAYLTVRGASQWTSYSLASSEQYRAGGAYSVRGYPEGDSSGDYGFNGTVELNSPLPIPKDLNLPFTKRKIKEIIRGVVFFDAGRTFLTERISAEDGKNKLLLGTGFGVRVNLDRTFSMQLDLGFPVGEKSVDEDQKQVHLSMRAGF